MSKSVFAVRFKGVNGVGYIAGKDEDAVRRFCKKKYFGKLISVKYDHELKSKKK